MIWCLGAVFYGKNVPGIFLGFKRIINVIKFVLLMFLIANTSPHILNKTVLVLLGTLGGYIVRFPLKQHDFYSNVPVKWVIWTMCLGDNLLDPVLFRRSAECTNIKNFIFYELN